MTQFRGKNKGSSNNINININLSMKDSIKPAGKKIQNNIKIGTSSMETKRMTLLTQRLKDKKRDLQSYHELDEEDVIKSKRNVYTVKKQRQKTNKNTPEQIITAFSTTKARAKYASKDIKQIKETPVKSTKIKQQDIFSKQKRTMSNQKLKSRRNSKSGIGSSVQNLRKVAMNRSPTKSESKSNSKSRSNSNRKCQNLKKKDKTSLQPSTKSASKQKLHPLFEGIQNNKPKNKVNPKAKDDAFVYRPPQTKREDRKKSFINNTIIDVPLKIPIQKVSRRTISTLVPKTSQKLNNQQTQISKQKIKESIIKIQKVCRGYLAKKKLLSQLQVIRNNNKHINSLISGNKKQFWYDCSINSIKFVNVDIEDSFSDKPLDYPRDLFSSQQIVLSVQNLDQQLNSFQKLMKMSEKIGDDKLAKQLRNMAQDLMKQNLQKKKIIMQNDQLKNDINQLKEQSINYHPLSIPLVIPQPAFLNQNNIDEPKIIMPVKLQKYGVVRSQNPQIIQIVQKIQKTEKIQKNDERGNVVEKIQKIDLIQKVTKAQIIPKETSVNKNQRNQQLSLEESLQKKKLIQQLKSFKGQSDSMMKVFKKQQKPIPKPVAENKQTTKIEKLEHKKQEQKQKQKQNVNKFLPQFQKSDMVVDYPMGNESSDSEQFREAIKKSELENNKRSKDEISNFMNKQTQSELNRNVQLLKPPEIQEIVNMVAPNVRQHSLDSDHAHQPEEGNEGNLQHQKKGFQTNLNFVKQYCIGLCEFIRGNEQIKNRFKHKILQPLKINLEDFLKTYRKTIEGQLNTEYNSFKSDYVYPYYKATVPLEGIIQKQTFDMFNQTLITLKRNTNDADPEDVKLQGVHLQSLLDVFNQSLNYERPSGIYGQALPWAPKVKHLKNINNNFGEVETDEQRVGEIEQYSNENQKFDQLFGVAIARVIQWGSSLCGFIPESLDLESNIHIDDEYINHIKQTRMALMLEKTLAQQQQKMLEFTNVETEVKLQVGAKLFEDLLNEVFQQFSILKESFQYLD